MFGQSNGGFSDDMRLAAGQVDDPAPPSADDDSFLSDFAELQAAKEAAGNTQKADAAQTTAQPTDGAQLAKPADNSPVLYSNSTITQHANHSMLQPTATSDNSPADSTIPTSAPSPIDNPQAANELIDIKQQALSQLSPLVSHLDQTPEEKFHTTMMMIRASDDQSLIKTAYEAAKQIGDEKVRAQALLDIVNEINYFTQQKQ